MIIACANPTMCSSRLSQRTIPAEILDEIVALLLARQYAFSSIADFSLASYQLRQIAFKRFFTRLYVRSDTYWNHVCQVPGLSSWVRVLECLTNALTLQVHQLHHFVNLQSVELDFSSDGLATQSSRAKRILKHLPAGLTHLALTFLPRIDTHLLALIASCYANLITLELSCAERLDENCCWLCFEESSSCAIHAPVPDMYATVDGLAISFAAALKPLKKLEHLYLGIYLSDLDVFHRHLVHCAIDILSSPAKPGTHSKPPFAPDECVICVARHAADVRARELFASALVARTLQSLKSIAWSSYFAEDEPGDDVMARSTNMWIHRKDGKIRVRRAPW